MMTMQGKMITLEPLDIQKHAKGYFEVCQDENIHKYTGNTIPKCIDETIELLKKYEAINSKTVYEKGTTPAGLKKLVDSKHM